MKICNICNQESIPCEKCEDDALHLDCHSNIGFDDGNRFVHIMCLEDLMRRVLAKMTT